jgi:hypothetical protein
MSRRIGSGSGAMLLVIASAVAACESASTPDDGEAGNGATGGSKGGTAGASGGKAGGGGTKVSGTGGSKSGGTGGSSHAGTSGALGGNAGAEAGGAGADQGNAGSNGGEPPGDEASRVELGTAEDFVILAKTGISTVPTSAVTGNLGVSPAAASYITGFSLTADGTNAFATSPQVTGKVYASDYAAPTPSDMTTAIGDMELAFTDAAGRAPDVTELGAGDIGGMTLAPGVYQWGTGLLIPTDITLKGSSTAVWIFQIAEDLTVSSAAHVVLSGGALAENVFWQVSGLVSFGTTAHFEGIVLTQTAVTLETGASINGRLLAQTAVSLDGNAVVEPAH